MEKLCHEVIARSEARQRAWALAETDRTDATLKAAQNASHHFDDAARSFAEVLAREVLKLKARLAGPKDKEE